MTAELLAFPAAPRPFDAAAAINQLLATAVDAALRDDRARCAALADVAAKAARLNVPFALGDAIAGGMSPEEAVGYVLEYAAQI